MTSADHPTTPSAPLSRREAREALRRPAPAASAPARRPKAPVRWSRRRGVAAMFATVAAVGLAGAYIGPAGLAMAETEPPAEATTVYSGSLADAQSLTVMAVPEAMTFDRGSYTAYEKPKPPPVVAAAPSSDGGGGVAAVLFYTGGGSAAEWMAAAGIPESDWGYVDYIVSRESGWNPNATNKSSGACGLVQALPCSKVPGNGYNPVDNLVWGTGYANGRYGGWAGAYAFWTSHHWW